MKFFWGATIVATILATVYLIVSLGIAISAVQEAAAAGIACAMVVIPYVFTRAMNELTLPRAQPSKEPPSASSFSN